jgi:hypothetical protein
VETNGHVSEKSTSNIILLENGVKLLEDQLT